MTEAAHTGPPPSDPASPTGQLCRWIASLTWPSVPAELRTRAAYLVLDGIGCALVGAHVPWSETAASGLLGLEPAEGTAGVIGHERRATPATAALLNSSFIQGFELDDWHIGAPLHSNSILLPALLAVGEHFGSSSSSGTPFSGQDLLLAYVAGLEVGPRVGLALHGPHMLSMGWHSGAVFGPPAAAAAVGKLLGLSPAVLEDAMGIACTQGGGLMSAQFESEVKRMQHGFAARAGLVGGVLARAGYVGIKRVFEREYGGFLAQFSAGNGMEAPGYEVREICRGLGEVWQMEGVAIKPYASMAGTLNTVDCLVDLVREHPGKFAREGLGRIERVLVELSRPVFEHGGWVASRAEITATGAQMNNAYVAATYLVDGADMPPQYAAAMLDRDEVWDLIGRITCELNGEFTKMRTRVTIWFRPEDGALPGEPAVSVSADRMVARGVVPPLTNEEILEKWRSITADVIDDTRRQQIENVVLGLEECRDIGVLAGLLAGTTRNPIA